MTSFKDKRTGIILAVEFKKPSVKIFYGIMFLFSILVALICLIPPLWIMISAFKDTKEFFRIPPTIIPESFDAQKLVRVWNETDFGNSFINSIIITVGSVIATLIVTGAAGYVLSRLKPKGTTVIMMLILWTIMFPNTINTVPLFMTFIDMPIIHVNLVNSYIPFWMMAGANAFNILLFKNAFDAISISLIEAARIDGCSDGGIFTRIVLPLSKPIVMTVTVFTVNANWGAFYWPFLLLKNSAMYPVGQVLYNLKTLVTIDEYMVALLFVILPPSLIFIVFQRYIVGGVNIGGVKG